MLCRLALQSFRKMDEAELAMELLTGGVKDMGFLAPPVDMSGSVMDLPTEDYSGTVEPSFFQLDDLAGMLPMKGLLGLAALGGIKPMGGAMASLFKDLAPKAVKDAEKRIVEAIPVKANTDAVVTDFSQEVMDFIAKLQSEAK